VSLKQHSAKTGRGRKKRTTKRSLVADINVTPLVDVVLVLLIIFMVVTPMIVGGVAVDLPKTRHHDQKPDDGKDLIISVTTNKEVYFMSNHVKAEDVTRLVEEEVRRFPDKTVYVKGDARTTYGAVRKVLEAVNKAKIENIMLGTDEVEKKTLMGGT
jgi:biopolymer transport protein ExbD